MVYTEKQSMRQYWWVLLISASSIIMMFTFWVAEKDPAAKQEIFTGLLIVVGLEASVLTLIFSMSLRTKVNEKGVTYSFKPFLRTKNIVWSDIEKVWVRKYKPIAEYGGWGFRVAWFKKTGKAYSVWGNFGLQMELKNGKKILIGTQKEKELVAFLKRLKEKYTIDVIKEEELSLYKK